MIQPLAPLQNINWSGDLRYPFLSLEARCHQQGIRQFAVLFPGRAPAASIIPQVNGAGLSPMELKARSARYRQLEVAKAILQQREKFRLELEAQEDALNELVAMCREFGPRPFAASPSMAILRTPWFGDFTHLIFWFFFFGAYTVVLMLVFSFTVFFSCVESRQPIRETRGFSRAQTGDFMTAVLPMTWSITMLMHASTHSSNFDENTAGTVFSMTVIAYQWGWNYYFPQDVARTFATQPASVGHGGIQVRSSQDFYALLLGQARLEFTLRTNLGGRFFAKHGQQAATQPLGTYSRTIPGAAALITQLKAVLDSTWEIASNPAQLESLRWADNRTLYLMQAQRQADYQAQLRASEQETQRQPRRTLFSINKEISGRPLRPHHSGLAELRRRGKLLSAHSEVSRPITSATWLEVPVSAALPLSGDAQRSRVSAAVVGNRIARVFHLLALQANPSSRLHLQQEADLFQKLAKTNSLRKQDNERGCLATIPAWFTSLYASTPIDETNVAADVWLAKTGHTFRGANSWLASVAQNSSTKRPLAWLGRPDFLFLTPRGSYNVQTLRSRLRHPSEHLALDGGRPSSLGVYEDVGYNSTSAGDAVLWRRAVESRALLNFSRLIKAGKKPLPSNRDRLLKVNDDSLVLSFSRLTTSIPSDRQTELAQLGPLYSGSPLDALQRVALFSFLSARPDKEHLASFTAATPLGLEGASSAVSGLAYLGQRGQAGAQLRHLFGISFLSQLDRGANKNAATHYVDNEALMLAKLFSRLRSSKNAALEALKFQLQVFTEAAFRIILQKLLTAPALAESTQRAMRVAIGSHVLVLANLQPSSLIREHLARWFFLRAKLGAQHGNKWEGLPSLSSQQRRVLLLKELSLYTARSFREQRARGLHMAALIKEPVETRSLFEEPKLDLNHDAEPLDQLLSWASRWLLLFLIWEIEAIIDAIEVFYEMPNARFFYRRRPQFDLEVVWAVFVEFGQYVNDTTGITETILAYALVVNNFEVSQPLPLLAPARWADLVFSVRCRANYGWWFLGYKLRLASAIVGYDLEEYHAAGLGLITKAFFEDSVIKFLEGKYVLDSIVWDRGFESWLSRMRRKRLVWEANRLRFNFSYSQRAPSDVLLGLARRSLFIRWASQAQVKVLVWRNFYKAQGAFCHPFDLSQRGSGLALIAGAKLKQPTSFFSRAKAEIRCNSGSAEARHGLQPITLNPDLRLNSVAEVGAVTSIQAPVKEVSSLFSFAQRKVAQPLGAIDGWASSLALESPVAQLPNADEPRWLEAADESKPLRYSSVGAGEPLQVNVRSELPDVTSLKTTTLFDWRWRWTHELSEYAMPLDKFYRASFIRRPQSGATESTTTHDTDSERFAYEYRKYQYSKNVSQLANLLLQRKQKLPLADEPTLPRLLDVEAIPLNKEFILYTPAPYLDLDPNFIFKKWTFELNTTRRSDHAARYRVTWGPLSVAHRLDHVSPSLVYGSVRSTSGPRFAQTLLTQTRQQLALTLQAELSNLTTLPLQNGKQVQSQLLNEQRSLRPIQGTESCASSTLYETAASYGLALQRHSELLDFEIADCLPLSVTPRARDYERAVLWSTLWRVIPQQTAEEILSPSNTEKARLNLSLRRWAVAERLREEWVLRLQQQSLEAKPAALATNPMASLLAALSSEKQAKPGIGATDRHVASSLTRKRDGHLALNTDLASMRRMRVTAGVTLPSDTPIHGIFGAKDVIHSWALPAANIKIDCIPGMNNHRRVNIALRALFWGQCMEVCGRLHHAMPILVHTVAPTSFTAWCQAQQFTFEPQAAGGSYGTFVNSPAGLSAILQVFC